jgi:hypothetical protein
LEREHDPLNLDGIGIVSLEGAPEVQMTVLERHLSETFVCRINHFN